MKKFDFEYIIIGAGPAGLQLGYFFEKENIDYCILEKGITPGGFFKTYPRHRKLISINKVHTGYNDPEVNMRWDWNSLLGDNVDLRLPSYTHEYFPNSDDFVSYLSDYVNHYNIRVKYNTEVESIKREQDGFFQIKCKDKTITCKYLITATGVPHPMYPNIDGVDLCENYSDCSIDTKDYINQKVLIIGKGNSGFEMADSLVGAASTIHLISPENVKFAWKTHYVGHLRAVNNNYLDTYLLKSQNAILNGNILNIRKNENGRYVVHIEYTKVKDAETEEIEYDRVIVACGFKMDAGFFNSNVQPELCYNDKFPSLTSEWESVNENNLYFAGILTHSRDFKVATSGFIHGFRYNCKALFEILMKKNNKKEFDSNMVANCEPRNLTDLLIEKINRSSALWQQFGFLGDVVIYNEALGMANYVDALPVDYIHEHLCAQEEKYFVITLEYGSDHRDPFGDKVNRINRFDMDGANESDFLHPVIRRYCKGELKSVCHLIEDLNGEFKRREHVEPLLEYFTNELKASVLSDKVVVEND